MLKLKKITHHFENILDELRKGNLSISNDICKLIFNTFDKFKATYRVVVATGKEPDGDEDIAGIVTEISRVIAEVKSPGEKILQTLLIMRRKHQLAPQKT